MTYKLVLVQGYDGQATPFALLRATAHAVFVCRPEVYEDVRAGRREEPMIGFPIDDVSTPDGQPFIQAQEQDRDGEAVGC